VTSRRQAQTRAEVVARAKPLAVQVARLLGRLGELEARRVLAEMGASAKAREATEAELRDELIALLSRFGIRQAASAASRTAAQTGGGPVFGRSPIAEEEGRRVVWVDIEALDSELRRSPSFYVGSGGAGGIGDRYRQAIEFLRAAIRNGTPVNMPEIVVRSGGDISVRDGRHRLAALRDLGVTRVPVTVDPEDETVIRRRVGVEPPAGGKPKAPVMDDLAFRGTLMRDAVEGKPTKIKWFWEYRNGVVERVNDLLATTKDEVRASVRQIVAEAQSEAKVPSMGEIARRIHTQFHGREVDGRIRVFSPERAAIIAQTELAQAENTGIVEGYKATGVEEIEWLARLGSERHGHMNGKRIKLGEYFVTERGNRLRYPGDPSAPIGETINCQCTTAPVIRRRTAKAITAELPDAVTLTRGEVATLKLRHGRG
jgi:hypothetical protein